MMPNAHQPATTPSKKGLLTALRATTAAVLLLLSSVPAQAGGVVMGATRVIYPADAREATITVKNKGSKHNYLIQSWVDDQSGAKKGPFVVTPPLFTLPSDKEGVLRIVRTGGNLPDDRESVFWLNVKAIPPKSEGQGNVLQLAIKTRMKLFWRPAGLAGKPAEAPAKLRWSRSGSKLIVVNDSPWSVTLSEVTLNGKKVEKTDLVPARGQASFALPSGVSGGSVTFRTINDFGGVSEPLTLPVQG